MNAKGRFNGLDEVIDVCRLAVDCPLYGEDYVAVIHTAPQVEFVAFLPWLQQQLGTLRAPQRVRCCRTRPCR